MERRRFTPIVLLCLACAACGADGRAADEPVDTAEPAPPTINAVESTTEPERIPVIVDYSPTSSDVAALLYVTQHPAADLLAVTLAGTGESHCEQGVANTSALLAAVGLAEVPVACGQEQPVGTGNEWPPAWRDAADRLDGLDLSASTVANPLANRDAADLLAAAVAENAPVTIIALGPLTNLAVAIEQHRELPERVARVVTMGGAVEVPGNTPDDLAEWNYFVDPAAVDVVLRSGIPVTIVPLDATNDVPVTKAWFDQLSRHRTTTAAGAVHDLFAASRPYDLGFFFWDELAVAVALGDGLATFEERPIVIDVAGAQQGRTRVDPAGTVARIAVGADRERFEHELLTTLNGGAEPPAIPQAAAEEVEYFRTVETAAATLGAEVEELFQTPLALEVEAIADRGDDVELLPGEEAQLREFFTAFWTGAVIHVTTFRDELAVLEPPDSVRAEHDEYVDALGAMIGDEDRRLADIRTRDAPGLLTILWEPDETIAAIDTACAALDAATSALGVEVTTSGLITA